jgi:hypothetical protein
MKMRALDDQMWVLGVQIGHGYVAILMEASCTIPVAAYTSFGARCWDNGAGVLGRCWRWRWRCCRIFILSPEIQVEQT